MPRVLEEELWVGKYPLGRLEQDMLCCLVQLQFCEILERPKELQEDWRHLGLGVVFVHHLYLWIDDVPVIVEVKDTTPHGPMYVQWRLSISFVPSSSCQCLRIWSQWHCKTFANDEGKCKQCQELDATMSMYCNIYGCTSVRNLFPSNSTQMIQFNLNTKNTHHSIVDSSQLHSLSSFGGIVDEPLWILLPLGLLPRMPQSA